MSLTESRAEAIIELFGTVDHFSDLTPMALREALGSEPAVVVLHELQA